MELKRQNTAFELALSLLVLILLSAGIVYWWVVPGINELLGFEEHKAAEVAKTQKLQKKYNTLYERKRDLKARTTMLQQRAGNTLALADLQEWITAYLQNAHVAPARRSAGYEVNATITSPAEFYDFIHSMQTAPWLLILSTPVKLQKTQTNIDVSFRVVATRYSEE